MAETDHFKAAENLLAEAADADAESAWLLVTRAGVHAQLAALQPKKVPDSGEGERRDEATKTSGRPPKVKIPTLTVPKARPSLPPKPQPGRAYPGGGQPATSSTSRRRRAQPSGGTGHRNFPSGP